jgi:NADH:ubiquinone oxidoreductase subunit 4 (subunit M)
MLSLSWRVLGIVITAAYILRAIHSVFFGEYEGDKWHDMRPLLGIDKLALIGFCVILIVIGVFPGGYRAHHRIGHGAGHGAD